MSFGTTLYALYDAPDGEVQFCKLEPGMMRGQVLVRDLRTPEFAAVDAGRIIHLFTLDRNGESTVYPFIRLRPMVTAAAVEREKARIAANVALPPVQMALEVGDFHMMTGYDASREEMLALRKAVPDLVTLRTVMLFALISAKRGNGEAEKLFFRLWPYVKNGSLGKMSDPDIRKIAETPTPEEAKKSAGVGMWGIPPLGDRIKATWDWCADFHAFWTANSRLRDRLLRRKGATEVGLPLGLGLAKFSFALELLGNNIACLDSHMLGILVGGARSVAEAKELGKKLSSGLSKKRKLANVKWDLVSAEAVTLYEKYEDMLVEDNEFYKDSDPVGYARAQWMTWEVLRGEATVHDSLFASIRAIRSGQPMRLPKGYLDNLKRGAHVRWMRLNYRWVDIRGAKPVSMRAKEFGARLKAHAKKYRSSGLKLVGNPAFSGKQGHGKGNLDVIRELLKKYGYSLERAGREVWLSMPLRGQQSYDLMVAMLDEYVQTIKEFPDDFGIVHVQRTKGNLYHVRFSEPSYAADFVAILRAPVGA